MSEYETFPSRSHLLPTNTCEGRRGVLISRIVAENLNGAVRWDCFSKFKRQRINYRKIWKDLKVKVSPAWPNLEKIGWCTPPARFPKSQNNHESSIEPPVPPPKKKGQNFWTRGKMIYIMESAKTSASNRGALIITWDRELNLRATHLMSISAVVVRRTQPSRNTTERRTWIQIEHNHHAVSIPIVHRC